MNYFESVGVWSHVLCLFNTARKVNKSFTFGHYFIACSLIKGLLMEAPRQLFGIPKSTAI